MKKMWENPSIETLNLNATAYAYDKGPNSDGKVWVTNNDGSGGWWLPDLGVYGNPDEPVAS